jgi:hypothetical protein
VALALDALAALASVALDGRRGRRGAGRLTAWPAPAWRWSSWPALDGVARTGLALVELARA